MAPIAVNVVPLPDHYLLVTFDNQQIRLFDVKPYFGFKAFKELEGSHLFNTVKIAGLSVEWLNGQDICPCELYYSSTPVKQIQHI